jgi:predicted kinase
VAGIVHLICGPPCGGKSTYVRKASSPSDLVVDFDALARAAGSPKRHEHDERFRRSAGAMWDQLVDRLASVPDTTAWVVRAAPQYDERARLARRIRADATIVLMPPMDVVIHRCARERRSNATFAAIREWYQNYSPGVDEFVVDE